MLAFKRFFTVKKYSPIAQLESIHKLSLSVNEISSINEKQALLAKFPACHSTLQRIYNPHARHYISSKTAKAHLAKQTSTEPPTFHNLDDLLDALSSRQVTGHAAAKAVASFYLTYCLTEAHRDIFWRIIDRNLKMGVSVQTVNHTLAQDPSLIDVSRISVALATSYMPAKLGQVNDWYVSQKLDGVRCIAMIRCIENAYDVQFYSRTGRRFTSLAKVKTEIENRLKETKETDEFVLDGEVCAYDDNAVEEDFLKASGQIRRVNEDMENPVYQVFDRISLKDFIRKQGDATLIQRQSTLKKFLGEDAMDHIKMVKQINLESVSQLESMKKNAIEKGWEGLILRKDVPYKGTRSKNMMKVKEWEDAEYTVKSVEMGLMRTADTGEDRYVVTNVFIEHKGNPVSVGSGFSMQNRIAYAKDPSLIIGKPITVRYFAEYKNENGIYSLRFPTVKAVYKEGKRDI